MPYFNLFYNKRATLNAHIFFLLWSFQNSTSRAIVLWFSCYDCAENRKQCNWRGFSVENLRLSKTLKKIEYNTFIAGPCTPAQEDIVWRKCVVAIDEFLRRKKRDGRERQD